MKKNILGALLIGLISIFGLTIIARADETPAKLTACVGDKCSNTELTVEAAAGETVTIELKAEAPIVMTLIRIPWSWDQTVLTLGDPQAFLNYSLMYKDVDDEGIFRGYTENIVFTNASQEKQTEAKTIAKIPFKVSDSFAAGTTASVTFSQGVVAKEGNVEDSEFALNGVKVNITAKASSGTNDGSGSSNEATKDNKSGNVKAEDTGAVTPIVALALLGGSYTMVRKNNKKKTVLNKI